MVPINLMPEILTDAQRAYKQARILLLFLLVGTTVGAGTVCGGLVDALVRRKSAADARSLGEEVRSFQAELAKQRKAVSELQAATHTADAVRVAREHVARWLLDIPALMPPRGTLSALHVNDGQVVITGVAGTRSDLAALVGALTSQGHGHVVWVERLKEVVLERYTLQDFVVKVRRDVSPASRDIGASEGGS